MVWSAACERVASLGGGAGLGLVRSLAVLPDGRLAAGYSDAPFTADGGPSLVRVWDVQRRALDAEISGHTNDVESLAALSDGRLLSGSRDETMKVWSVPPAAAGALALCSATLGGHTGPVYALARLPDGRVVSGSLDGTVRMWA